MDREWYKLVGFRKETRGFMSPCSMLIITPGVLSNNYCVVPAVTTVRSHSVFDFTLVPVSEED